MKLFRKPNVNETRSIKFSQINKDFRGAEHFEGGLMITVLETITTFKSSC